MRAKVRLATRAQCVLISFCWLTFPLAHANEPQLPIIGVTEITAPVDDPFLFNRVNTKAENFQVMLETQLAQIGRFKIIERNRIDQILAEQGLNNAFGDGQTAGGGFNVAGVDYLVYGAVTKFGTTVEDVSTGSFRSQKQVTHFDADIKVVDAATGEIRIVETAAVRLETASALSTGNFQTGNAAGDPLADIQRLAAKKVAAIIATSIFPLEVVKGDEVIYVNYGRAILNVGDRLTAFAKGEDLIDESTGIHLGSEEEEIATVEIFEVTDAFSKARLLSGTTPMRGALLRLTAQGSDPASGRKPGEKRGRKI